MRINLRVITIDKFRGKHIMETEKVSQEATIEVERPELIDDSLESAEAMLNAAAGLVGSVIATLKSFGYSIEPNQIKMASDGKHVVAMTGIVYQSASHDAWFIAQAVPEKTPEPEPQPEPAQSTRSDGDRVNRIVRTWRSKIDVLMASKEELEVKAKHGALTVEELAKYNQLVGALKVLKPVINELQLIRPVNQSTLNV